jgi:hypothetical protein
MYPTAYYQNDKEQILCNKFYIANHFNSELYRNLIQINHCHCNAILAYECCGLPWFRGVSQYSWSSPTQLGASENILNAKRKCHIKHFISPEILNSKKNSEIWHA